MSETTTIEATTRPVEPIDPAADALQDFVLARHSSHGRTHFSNPARFDTRCSFSRSSGEDYPHSLEAEQASEHLIEVAEQFEREGDLRQAQGIYEELL